MKAQIVTTGVDQQTGKTGRIAVMLQPETDNDRTLLKLLQPYGYEANIPSGTATLQFERRNL